MPEKKKVLHSLKGLKMHSMLERIDAFGQRIPAFNMKGRTRVHTLTGGCFTFFVVVILLVYSSITLLQLMNKHNPSVSEVKELDFYNFKEILSLKDIDFKIAFSVEGYHSRELKNDHRYVKYLVRTFGFKDGVQFEEILDFHECTDDDWATFQKPDKSSFDTIAEIKRNPKRGMFCLDKEVDIRVYGNERNDNYQRLELVLVPCNYIHTHLGYEGDSVHPECVADLAK